jgi:hypothetical protein
MVAAWGSGTMKFRRTVPTKFSTEPFSLPLPGMVNTGVNS